LNSLVNENKDIHKNIIYCENRDHKSYTKYSPFTDYFSKIIKNHSKNIHSKRFKLTNLYHKTNHLNHYYCPQIFKILNELIHIMPLWSNVLLVLWNSYYNFAIERLTNNPGENWFDQIKESLKNFLPVMPSQYANFLYSLVEAYFEEFSALKLTSLKKYPDFNNDATENWSKGCERI